MPILPNGVGFSWLSSISSYESCWTGQIKGLLKIAVLSERTLRQNLEKCIRSRSGLCLGGLVHQHDQMQSDLGQLTHSLPAALTQCCQYTVHMCRYGSLLTWFFEWTYQHLARVGGEDPVTKKIKILWNKKRKKPWKSTCESVAYAQEEITNSKR